MGIAIKRMMYEFLLINYYTLKEVAVIIAMFKLNWIMISAVSEFTFLTFLLLLKITELLELLKHVIGLFVGL